MRRMVFLLTVLGTLMYASPSSASPARVTLTSNRPFQTATALDFVLHEQQTPFATSKKDGWFYRPLFSLSHSKSVPESVTLLLEIIGSTTIILLGGVSWSNAGQRTTLMDVIHRKFQ